jgi:hypothetical protein
MLEKPEAIRRIEPINEMTKCFLIKQKAAPKNPIADETNEIPDTIKNHIASEASTP